MTSPEIAAEWVKLLTDTLDKLPPDRDSEWLTTVEAAKALGLSKADLKKTLRRPRVKAALIEAGLGCSWRGQFLYVYKNNVPHPS